jgi:hypothetical protein
MSFLNFLILSMYDVSWEDGWNDLSMSIGLARYSPDSVRTIIISAIEGHTKKKSISVHDVIFCFGILRYSILDFFVLGYVDIPCYLLELFIHVQDVNDITASYGRFGLFAIGFIFLFCFLVVIEIESLARLRVSLMFICLVYFEVFQTLSSRILCLLC